MLEKKVFKSKFNNLEKAINSFKEASVFAKKEENNEKIFNLLRDSVIQRFEYSYELSWKFMKFLLEKKEKEIETRWARQCLKTAFRLWYIDNLDIWFDMIDYRNKTSHEYEQDIADSLYDRSNEFLEEMIKFYELIKIKQNEQGYFE